MKYDPQKHNRRSIRLDGYDYSQAGAYFVTIVTQGRACLFGEIVNGQMRLNAAGRIVQWEWQRLGQRFPNLQLDAFVVMPNHVHGIIIIRGDRVGATHPEQTMASAGKDAVPDRKLMGNDGSHVRDGDGVGATRPGQTITSAGKDAAQNGIVVGHDGSPIREGDGVGATHPEQTVASAGKDAVPDGELIGNDGSPLPGVDGGSPLPPNGPVPGSLGAIIGQFKSRVTKHLWAKPGLTGIPVWQRNYYEHIIRNDDDHRRICHYIQSNPDHWMIDDENLLELAQV